jgi:hypothetical protein
VSIIVVCRGCRKSFKVSDKFAGQTGPCPSCKRPLRVPTKAEEVKIEAPEEFAGGGKSASGQLITKPIARINARFRPLTTAIIVASAAAALVAARLGRPLWITPGVQGFLAQMVGLLIISPPLVIAAYEVLRDDELEPYRGAALYLRTGLCSLAYAALWGIFGLLAYKGWVGGKEEVWNWLFVVPGLAAFGGVASLAALDLDFGDGISHYGFYLVATVLLRWVAGLGWVWNVS